MRESEIAFIKRLAYRKVPIDKFQGLGYMLPTRDETNELRMYFPLFFALLTVSWSTSCHTENCVLFSLSLSLTVRHTYNNICTSIGHR